MPSPIEDTNMTDLDGEAIIAKYCGQLGNRVRYDAGLSSTRIEELSCAVVLVNAFWSGPSMKTLVELANLLHEVDGSGRIEMIVCDTDHIPDLSIDPWRLHTLGGRGEIAWVCNGAVVARRHSSNDPDIRETTRLLLRECDK
ncbi:hypothetical protein [Roseiconus lacunae]|uniref:hypothetical protein n=1 Tax=Roseiconus lacunae TaxID=2605694 RepID=UPI001E54FF46|nr:hypothetical protein [Roseiconus lacunae]